MLDRATLHVLAEAAEIGLPETALVPVRAYDPFLRRAIARRVQKAIAEAEQRTTHKRGDHVLRVAFLSRHPQAPQGLDPNDQRAVEVAFDALAAEHLPPKPVDPTPKGGAYRGSARDADTALEANVGAKRRKRFWPITTPLLATTLLGAMATAAVIAAPYVIPTPAERFRKTPAGQALAEPLTDLIARKAKAPREKLLAPEVRKQIGGPATDALAKTLDTVEGVETSSGDIDAATKPFFASINTTNARLHEAKIPVYLHGYASGPDGHRGVWITSYFVERRDELAFEGATFRVAWGRRLDHLNLADDNIYKATAEDWAILSLDKVEEEFVQTMLSPIANGSPMFPVELTFPEGTARAELAKTAGRLVSEEVKRASGLSSTNADALRKAIARRNEAAVGLAKNGYRMGPSSRIELEPHRVKALEERAPVTTHDEKMLLDELLRMNGRMSLYRSSVAPAVAELARLEEEELVGRLEGVKRLETVSVTKLGPGDHARGRALASAELGMLARSQTCPRLALMRVARLVVDSEGYRRADISVVRDVLVELLVELGQLPPLADGAVHFVDDAFLNGLRATLEMPPEKVRDAAGKVHQRLFGMPAPKLTVKKI